MYRFSNMKICDKNTLFFSPHHTPFTLFTKALLPAPSYFLSFPPKRVWIQLSQKDRKLQEFHRILPKQSKQSKSVKMGCKSHQSGHTYILLPFAAHQIFPQYFRSEIKMMNFASCPKENGTCTWLSISREGGVSQ